MSWHTVLPRSATAIATATLFALLPVPGWAQAPGSPATLPAGHGKDLVEGVCTVCHRTNEIVRSMGYTKEGWQELTSTMIDLSKTPEQREQIVSYLAEHFPPGKNPRPARQVDGDTQIAFKQWTMPTLGQRSRDPVQGTDGKIWFVGQFANLIGWINPDTNEIREFPLPAGAYPHTVTLDREGNAWWTGNKNGTIGKFDPKTEKHTVYNMPDPKVKDPHTAEFDKKGILWFSAQQSDYVGRLDPATGDVKVWKVQTPNARPYAVKIDSKGNVWISCNGAPCLIRINPSTFEIAEFSLPLAGTTVRRLDIDSKDRIWYVNSGRGRLGVYDPDTGNAKEWDSPSGRSSHPYGIVVVDDIVWYNESNVRPDMLVRFDPKTEKFQSWPIPSGGIHAGIVRHMRATREGNLLIHQSSTNRITLVTPRPPLTR